MSGKKLLIIMIVLGLVTFSGAFVLTRVFQESPETSGSGKTGGGAEAESTPLAGAETVMLSPREIALEKLIGDLQHEKQQLDQRLQALNERKQRITIAADQIKTASLELESMRVQLAAPLIPLKGLIQNLEDTRILIPKEQVARLQDNAKTLAAMTADRSAGIVTSMCAGERMDDAARVVWFMPDRDRAKMFGAMLDEKVVAELLDRVKKIRQEEG